MAQASDNVNAFVKVLVRTSPMTADDIADLRALFGFHCASGESKVYVPAAHALRALRLAGLPHAELEENGGLLVQEGAKPSLLVNEQEFLLVAARLFRQEFREKLQDGYMDLDTTQECELRAARLFRGMDPGATGRVAAKDLRQGLFGLGGPVVTEQQAAAVCDSLAHFERALDKEDGDESYFTEEEFVAFAAPVLAREAPP